MDRFIAVIPVLSLYAVASLKSNMDRFIAEVINLTNVDKLKFKIQYG